MEKLLHSRQRPHLVALSGRALLERFLLMTSAHAPSSVTLEAFGTDPTVLIAALWWRSANCRTKLSSCKQRACACSEFREHRFSPETLTSGSRIALEAAFFDEAVNQLLQ